MSDEPAEAGAVIRLLVAEDTSILRETLVTLFSLEDGIEVVAQVVAGTGIVPAALEHRPDVALLDIGMPGVDGLSAAVELARRLPDCKVVVLTALETPDNRRRAGQIQAAPRSGMWGFLAAGRRQPDGRNHHRRECY